MKKRIILVLLLVLFLTGCFNKKENTEQPKTTNDDAVMVTVNGKQFKMHPDGTLKDMHYLDNYGDFYSDAIGNIRVLSYFEKGECLFEIRMTYNEDRSFDDLKASFNAEEQSKMIGNINYTYFSFKNDKGDDVHAYLYNYSGVTYTVAIVSKIDVTNFEEIFMKNVYYEKAN